MPDAIIYHMEFNRHYFKKGIECAFNYIESMDNIVSVIKGRPSIIKELIYTFFDEISLDFVYQGIGRFRTAYIQYCPYSKDNELLFLDKDEHIVLKLIYI